MKNLLGNYTISQTLSDEVLLVSYEYNSQQPRFFSKYFSVKDPAIYDVPVGNATASSSAAPTFFDPRKNYNAYGYDELQIDGAVISNNPSLYAYHMAKDLHGHNPDKIRLLSLGTGETPFYQKSVSDFSNKLTYMAMLNEFMMNTDVYATHYYLQTVMKKENYFRAQMVSSLPMDKVDPKSVQNLIDAGNTLWEKVEVDVK